MFVVLRSALEYWRWVRPIETGLGPRWAPNNDVPVSQDYPPLKAHAVDNRTPSDDDVSAALRRSLHTLSVPVHVAVSTRHARGRSPLKTPHLILGDLPEGSFASVSEGVHVSTPEHLFIHMATQLDLEELVWLGSELCNRYCAIHPDGEGLLPARPLSTTKLLAGYLDKAAGMRGYQNAQKALPYILDNAASPMETVVAMLLCLPMRHGGYGLPAPVLNSWMCVEGRQRREVSQGHYACDLLWPDAKLALEYDGEQSHVGLDRIAQDAERRNDLHHLDISVLSITKRQLGSAESFDRVARQIAKRLGTRMRLDECRYDWHARHAALRDKLLPGGVKLDI